MLLPSWPLWSVKTLTAGFLALLLRRLLLICPLLLLMLMTRISAFTCCRIVWSSLMVRTSMVCLVF